jgi:DNA repair protein RecN (Recombination protein N)
LVTVFDEIDSGVGGNVAQSIGECLADLAQNRQVIAVTHLATVAARAQHHFVVEKTVADGQTTTSVRRLSADERPAEVARMLAGDGAAAEALALAKQLLSSPS